ncbi:MAG TPA: TolC family protein [Vicinamibacterales bacterium]|nr:TolC family protein [Vicinamibacterales bacterium]
MRRVLWLWVFVTVAVGGARVRAQMPAAAPPRQPSPQFLGSVPSGQPTAEPLQLSILDAINRGLDHNLGILLADDARGREQGERWRTLGELLPNLNGRVAESRQLIDLAAYGFPLPEGIPSIVGPFNLFDARVSVSQSIFDLHAINNYRAEKHTAAAIAHTYQGARELVVLVAANAYLQTLAASARADAARAQLQSAQALYNQANDMKQNGLVAGIDVLRAQVELNTEKQRVTATANDFEKAKLQLGRIIGLPPGQDVTLMSNVPDVPVPQMTLEDALQQAYKARPDYLAALERVKAAEATRAAAVGDNLPSVVLNADYGELVAPTNSHYTFSVVGAVNVPIFQGGRTRGRVIEADADLKSRRAEADDLHAAIYYDVKTAFMDLQASGEQLQVATGARQVAETTLAQARDRFAAGVTSNIEVVQAQEAVSLANEQYINALYSYNVGKAVLARNLGDAEAAVRRYLGGSR